MKYLLILLFLLIPITSYSTLIETTLGDKYALADETVTATGSYCALMRGYPDRSYTVDITAGTATFDIIMSPTSDGIDLASDVEEILTDSTVDAIGTKTSADRYMCVRVTACSSCSLSVYLTGAR